MAPDVSKTPEPTVLVDALNVLRSQWPNMPEDELLERCRAWAKKRRCRAVVVFDGNAPEGLVGERELDGRCLLVGSGRESADDWIVRAAAELQAASKRYWLVTSDRGLRDAAGGGAERMVGGGSFAGELRRLSPESAGRRWLVVSALAAPGSGLLVSFSPYLWADIEPGVGTALYLLWQMLPFVALSLRPTRGAVREGLALFGVAAGTILAQVATIESERPALGLALVVVPALLTLAVGTDTLPRLAGALGVDGRRARS